MRGDPGSFATNDANCFPARRNLPVHQFFNCKRVSNVVRQWREIIQPISVRDELVVLHVLGDFFVAAMQEADVWCGFGNDLAVELEHESQNAVRGGVRWPHIEDHLFADVVISMMHLCVRCDYSCHGIRRFYLTRREGHGRSYKVTTLQSKTDNILRWRVNQRVQEISVPGVVATRPLAAP